MDAYSNEKFDLYPFLGCTTTGMDITNSILELYIDTNADSISTRSIINTVLSKSEALLGNLRN